MAICLIFIVNKRERERESFRNEILKQVQDDTSRFFGGLFFINQSSKFRRPELVSGPQKAFTLAEVLITLAIIGVVAALTIPTVVKNYQKQQTVVKLKKVYATLGQAINMAVVDYGDTKSWELVDGQTKEGSLVFCEKYLYPYLKISKKCGDKETDECSFVTKGLNGKTTDYSSRALFFLTDGTSINIESIQDLASTTVLKKYAQIFVDLNGQKPPNTHGKDIFGFDIFIDTTIPELNGKIVPRFVTRDRDTLISDTVSMCNKNQNGLACSALIAKDGWQMKDDYPW